MTLARRVDHCSRFVSRSQHGDNQKIAISFWSDVKMCYAQQKVQWIIVGLIMRTLYASLPSALWQSDSCVVCTILKPQLQRGLESTVSETKQQSCTKNMPHSNAVLQHIMSLNYWNEETAITESKTAFPNCNGGNSKTPPSHIIAPTLDPRLASPF